MFKKNTVKKSRAALRQRPAEDDSDEGGGANDDTTTTQAQLAATRKKRKLLTTIQYKKGVTAADLQKSEGSLLVGVDKTKNNANTAEAASKVSTAAETSRDGALEQKHRQAMEAYVAQHMGRTGTETQESKVKTSQAPLSEDALYLDLAAQAAKMAGKPVTTDNQVSEERGAVLVAGTGIAEVILPVEERLQVAQATTQAHAEAASQRRAFSRAQHRSFIRPQQSAMPNRFAVATQLTDQEFRQQYGRDVPRKTSKMDQTASSSTATTTTTTADETRPGFEAVRQSLIAPSSQQGHARQQQHPHQQASDHKVFSKFVARQREMRK